MKKSNRNNVKLTVFTPTYNRAHTLPRLYNSLVRQSCQDFKWLIIDDGSSDNTRILVDTWRNEQNGFDIVYNYKKNGGMHTAHNRAYELIDTELNVCIDSDDFMADDAVESILKCWNEKGSDKLAGIIGLDADFGGEIIGKGFPDGMEKTTLSGYYSRGGAGDKKLVYRTEVMKKYPPYPVFKGEKYVSLGYKYLLCDQDYELLTLDKVLCYVEYQADGSSKNMLKQYMRNPNGFAFIRKVDMKYDKTLKRKFMTCVHYVSSSMIGKNKRFVKESPKKLMTILAVPFGWALTCYIKLKSRE